MPPVLGDPDAGAAHGEVRVAQSIAEGEGRFHAEAVEEPVAHIDALPVELVLQVAVEVAVLLREGQLAVALGPGIGELPGGGDRAGEDIRHGVSPLLAQLAEEQDGVDAGDLLHEAHVQGGAAVDGQNKALVLLRTEADGLPLPVGEEEVPLLRPAVAALARLTADHVDAGIRLAGVHVRLGDRAAAGGLEIVEEQVHDGALEALEALGLLFLVGLRRLLVDGLVLLQPPAGGDLNAPVLQSLQNGDGAALVHLSGAGAALDGPGRAGTVKGDLFGPEGQRAIVFQQHDPLAGGLVGHRQILPFPLAHRIGAAGSGQQLHSSSPPRPFMSASFDIGGPCPPEWWVYRIMFRKRCQHGSALVSGHCAARQSISHPANAALFSQN